MTSVNRKGGYGRFVSTIISAVDLLIFNLAFYVTVISSPDIYNHGSLRVIWLLVNVAYVPVAYWSSQSRRARSIYMENVLVNSLVAVSVHALFFMAMLTFLGINDMSFGNYGEFYGITFVALPLWWILSRLIVKRFRKRGRNFLRVVIVGTNATARRLYAELSGDASYGYRVYGFFGNNTEDGLPARYLGEIGQLKDYILSHSIDEVFYALTDGDDDNLAYVTKTTDDCVTKLYYVPQIPHTVPRNFQMYKVGSMPVISTRSNPLHSMVNRALKRTFDVVLSCVFLLVSPVVFIPIAIAIKMSSPGPVFFIQRRTGYRGCTFPCIKFRTMRVNQDADTLQATKRDPRKTRVGDFLRRTNLDELPQFVNVFLGQMSIVGPRPHMLKHTEDYTRLVDKYMVRHVVKPGITGWAQVNGYRGLTDELWKMERRVEYDVWYIENWSLPLDLKIVVLTAFKAFLPDKNAF
jgi:putative colanic acid biosynthesis UDP-glucose lipid carrier transferase